MSDISTLLLVSADPARAAFLVDQLSADGFDVACADSAAMAARALERVYPDVVIAETRLPDGPGLQVVSALREADRVTSRVDPLTPLIALTPSADPIDRVRALERGADDVVSVPLHYPELLARTRALLRRANARPRESLLRVGPMALDPIARTVALDDEPVDLSAKEYALLRVLASEPTRVFDKDELVRAIWGFRAGERSRTLDSHACRLRQKLACRGARFVVNVWGVGYKLVDGPVAVTTTAERPANPQATHGLTRLAA